MPTTLTKSRPKPIPIRLPDLPSVPEGWRDVTVRLTNLLRHGDNNAKLSKSNSSGLGYLTCGLSLAPARESGHNLCPASTAGCRAACLYRQGMARAFPDIQVGRLARAIAFKKERDWFEDMLRYELGRFARRAANEGLKLAVRLNVVSDIQWERETPWVFEDFPETSLYDYSKIKPRMMKFLKGDFPPNYHLTFSRGERNEGDAIDVLSGGGNVAVVFAGRVPAKWMSYPVHVGDNHDLRFLDPPNVVVGLSAKGSAKNDRSGFVIHEEERT